MKKLRNNKIRKLLAFMVALALMVSCMPSAYTISASEAFGDGTDDIFTDGEITSESSAEELTPDVSSADQGEQEQAQQTTLTYENDSVKVTAEALEDGALPQNTTLRADGVSSDTSVSYDTTVQKLMEAAQNRGSSLRGFFAYDVYFADANGSRVEPNGRIRVTFEYKTPAEPGIPDVAGTSVTVEKLHYNSSTGETEVNALQADGDLKVLNVNEAKQIQTLQAETGNTAVFAIMWDAPEAEESAAENEETTSTDDFADGTEEAPQEEAVETEAPAAEEQVENPDAQSEETPAENQDAQSEETPAENPEAEPTETPAENPEAEPTETPDAEVTEAPAEDAQNPDENTPAAEEDQNTEATLIEVIADETNLRVSPSTDAEVIATVDAGTQLTLLDTVTAEDETIWYKVSYEEMEAYIRSDMAKVVGSEETEEETEELETEEVTYTKTIENVEVTATANRGVLPEDAELVVNPIQKEDAQYSEVEAQLNEKAEKESYTIAGFLAYDIYFQDSEGNKLEPQDGSVKVSMAYKEAEIPDSVAETEETENSAMNIAVMHFVEDEDGNVTNVVDMSNEGQAEVNTTDNGEIESAKFETESFSAFSIVWQSASDLISTQAGFSTIDTVNSKSAGITINMFDYEQNKITSGKTLEFRNQTNGTAGYNIWTGDLIGSSDANGHRFSAERDTAKKTPYQGIMQKLLGNSGYPVLNVGSGEDTAYLFSTTNNGGSVYSDLNNLFTKDSDGYYEYDSDKNYAYLNGSNFEVYNVTGTSSAANGTSGGQNKGGFFPFNPLAQNSTALTWGSSIRNIETGSGAKTANYHFGMTMSANFMQPENGTVNNKAMKFEFSGDDDVWVYIDGVLVLDIGGLHDAVGGSIDFETGDVKVDNETSTNLKALFEAANKSTDTGFTGNTFSNYTKHTINFYYLERGAGASNCHLKFNLTTVPEGTVAVEKKLSNTDKEKYANVDFKFQLLAQEITGKDANGNDIYSDTYVPVAVGDNGVTASLNNGTALAASDFKSDTINNQEYAKVFTLKPGQKATFAGLKKDRKYKVVELGVKSDEYDQVTINDVTKSDPSGNITSDEATVGDRPWVVFTNKCSAFNRRELKITKKIKNEVSVGDDTFSFKILLSNQNNELSPYANGDYYLTDENGNYWYYNPAGALTSNGENPIVCGKTSAEGIVTGVRDGWTVGVRQILSGTSFSVEEVDLDGTKYNTPEKTVKNTDDSVIETSAISGADGKITLRKDALVTITNDPKNTDSAADETFIKVSKTFNGLTAKQIGELASADPAYKISVTGTKKDSSTGTSSEFTQDLYLGDARAEGQDTTWTYTWTIKGCGTGTYTVKESNYNKNGYTTNITINGTEVTDPENNGVEVTTEASNYSYTEKSRVTSCNKTDYEIGQQNLIVAKLTKGQGTFVWTRNPASINERLAIIELIKGINGFDNNASLDNCYFYSGKGIEGTLIFRNAKIKYDCENILHFDYPKQWAMFATGTYTITGGQNAEVKITNTYTEQTADLDLIKILNSTGSDETRLTGAEFDLYKKDGSSYTKVNTDPIVVDNDYQEEALKNLKTGLYYLEETKAPTGCMILNERIYFKQENSTITLTGADGKELQTDNVMWSLSSDNNTFVLKIKNNELYELPSSGGPGIYGFTISGVAILATALLLFINNKRREEEAKRS